MVPRSIYVTGSTVLRQKLAKEAKLSSRPKLTCHPDPAERDPTFSSAPICGASGRVVEGSALPEHSCEAAARLQF